MAKTTGKLKYDLALTTTSVYDASSVYINKSAELSINGNASLNYKTIGPTYADNGSITPLAGTNLAAGPTSGSTGIDGKGYIYIRNLGPTNASNIRVSALNTVPVGADVVSETYDTDQIMDIAINEFAFFPYVGGASTTTLYMRAGYSAAGVGTTGATYNDVEYGYFRAIPNIDGPKY